MDQSSRYYRIAGITIQINSDIPFKTNTLHQKFELFRVDEPNDDLVVLHHHFEWPDMDTSELGKPAYFRHPWAIYPTKDGWIYLGILPDDSSSTLWTVAKFSHDHSIGHIYHPNNKRFESGGLLSLTGFATDQIWISRLLADRNGCYFHSAGAILDGAGFLFVGHSEAGKSTITQMLIDAGIKPGQNRKVEILCDDRNILRFGPGGWMVHGSWSHGDIPIVSSNSAPLKAVCFLEKADNNILIRLEDRRSRILRLLACLVRPFLTANWWKNSLDILEELAEESKLCFVMRFDKSGAIVDELFRLL